MNTNVFEIRSEKSARDLFWREMPHEIRRHRRPWRTQNFYPTDVRVAWCDWVDAAQKSGRMSESLAQKVTL